MTKTIAGVGVFATLLCVSVLPVSAQSGPTDSTETRLFFAPTARSLEAGKAYLGVYEIQMPVLQVGITDRISIGGGTPLFFGTGDFPSMHPFWVTPKVQVFRGEATQAAVGAVHVFGLDGDSVGLAYGVVTSGSRDNAVTVLVGRGYSSFGAGPTIVMIGGERRISRTRKLVTENYISRGVRAGSLGVRFLGKKFTCDLGMIATLGDEYFFTFPVVNVAWRF